MKLTEIPNLAISSFVWTRRTSTVLLIVFGFVFSVQCNVLKYTGVSQRIQSATKLPLQQSNAPNIDYFQSQVIQSTRTSRRKKNPLTPGCVHFMDMIFQGESFVDKSMFILYLLDSDHKVNLITTPRRWGKTMNIGMLKYFFQAQVDVADWLLPRDKMSNYILFTNKTFIDDEGDMHILDQHFKISQYPNILNAHLGNHFVIHLDFGRVAKSDFNTVATSIIQVMEELFAKVGYVETMLIDSQLRANSSQLQKKYSIDIAWFNAYKDHTIRGYTLFQYTNSLVFLCRVMKQQSDLRGLQSPIILLDEYDSPINNAYIGTRKWPQEELNTLLDFFSSFLQSTLKANEEYRMAVITGGLRIVNQELFTGINHFQHLNFLNSEEVFFYYGFHEDEVKELLKRYNVDETEAKAMRGFYSGYRGGKNFELSIYNPWDIASYFCKRELKSYWMDTGLIRVLLASYSPYEIYQRQLLNLVAGYPVRIFHAAEVRKEDLEEVRKNLHSTRIESDINLGNLLRLLFAAGYLTYVSTEDTCQSSKINTIYAKIPNTAIKIELSLRLREDLLESFYEFVGMYDKNTVNQKNYLIFKCTFLNYLQSTSTDTAPLIGTCMEMLMTLPDFVHKSSLKVFWLKRLPAITGNEALARLIFDYTVVFESNDIFSYVGLEETYQFLGTTRRIDLALTFKDKKENLHAVIIEYKYSSDISTHKKEETSLNAVQQCLNYSSVFFAKQLDGVKSLKCLGISVQSTKVVTMDNYYIDEPTFAKFTEALNNLLKSHKEEEKKINMQSPSVSDYQQKMKALIKKSNDAYLELTKMFLL